MVCPPPQAEGEESDGFQEPCGLDRDGEEGETSWNTWHWKFGLVSTHVG